MDKVNTKSCHHHTTITSGNVTTASPSADHIGEIVGIVIGVLVAVVIISVIIYYYYYYLKRRRGKYVVNYVKQTLI